MKRGLLLAAVLLTGLGITSVVRGALDRRGPQLTLQVRYFEEQKGEKPIKHLETSIETPSGSPVHLKSGGEALTEGFDGPLAFGNFVEGTLVKKPDGKAAVDLKLTTGGCVSFKNQKDVMLVRSDVIQIRAVVKLGEKRKLNCSGGRWCEIEVRE